MKSFQVILIGSLVALGSCKATPKDNEIKSTTEQSATKEVAQGTNFDGKVGNYTKTLVGKGYGIKNDISKDLQKFIDEVSSQPNGGTIKISGEVHIENVKLKSNVHIDIAKGTIIKTSNRKKSCFFDIGLNAKEKIENVKIYSSTIDRSKPAEDINEKYIFDLTNYKVNDGIRMFMLGNVENFWISDFYAKDNLTRFSCITMNPVMIPTNKNNSNQKGLWDYDVIASPTKGDITNIYGDNLHKGYGVIQVQCAKNVRFENLSGIGGVTLRLESGAGIQYAGTYNCREHGTITDIRAYNLSSTNGFATVTMSPHGRLNGSVYLDNIKSVSSAFTVKVAKGFFDRELYVGKGDDRHLIDSVKYKKGKFLGPIIVKNVHAKFGLKAIGRVTEYAFVEQSLQKKYPWSTRELDIKGDTKTKYIPSLVALGYRSIDYKGEVPTEYDGKYIIQVEGPITSEGFQPCIVDYHKNILYEGDKKQVDCSKH